MDNSVSIESLLQQKLALMKTPQQIIAHNETRALPITDQTQPLADNQTTSTLQEQAPQIKNKRKLGPTTSKILLVLLVTLGTFILNLKVVRSQFSKYIKSPLVLTALFTLIIGVITSSSVALLWH